MFASRHKPLFVIVIMLNQNKNTASIAYFNRAAVYVTEGMSLKDNDGFRKFVVCILAMVSLSSSEQAGKDVTRTHCHICGATYLQYRGSEHVIVAELSARNSVIGSCAFVELIRPVSNIREGDQVLAPDAYEAEQLHHTHEPSSRKRLRTESEGDNGDSAEEPIRKKSKSNTTKSLFPTTSQPDEVFPVSPLGASSTHTHHHPALSITSDSSVKAYDLMREGDLVVKTSFPFGGQESEKKMHEDVGAPFGTARAQSTPIHDEEAIPRIPFHEIKPKYSKISPTDLEFRHSHSRVGIRTIFDTLGVPLTGVSVAEGIQAILHAMLGTSRSRCLS